MFELTPNVIVSVAPPLVDEEYVVILGEVERILSSVDVAEALTQEFAN